MSSGFRRRNRVGASSHPPHTALGASRLAALPPDGFAELLLLLPDLSGGVAGSEIRRLENLANLDFCSPVERSAFEPFNRFFLRLHLPKPETGDQLLRLGEGPVDHGPLPTSELDARTLRARLEPFGREHHTGLHQFFVELPHFG